MKTFYKEIDCIDNEYIIVSSDSDRENFVIEQPIAGGLGEIDVICLNRKEVEELIKTLNEALK
ncbi:hypothetical protein [Erwinia phage FBB1]|nr:hypothetical protein [Erwinia phage FBB1]